MGHRHLAVLVSTLLGIGHLVFDLDGTSARLDHPLGQQVGGLFVTEARVDVGDDRYHVCFVVVDGLYQCLFPHLVTGGTRRVEVVVEVTKLARICLAQEGVELFNQRRHRRLLVHGLVGQRPEFTAQRSNHPAGQVQIALVGSAVVLLDGNQLLLTDKAMPATQRLRVLAAVGIVLGHVATHDARRVARNVQAGAEAVLVLHARGVLGVNIVPGATLRGAQCSEGFNVFQVV